MVNANPSQTQSPIPFKAHSYAEGWLTAGDDVWAGTYRWEPADLLPVHVQTSLLAWPLRHILPNVVRLIVEKLLDCQGTQTVTAIEADVAWHSLEMCLVDGWHERSAQGWSKRLSGANSFVFFLVIYNFSFSKALTFLILLYFKKNNVSN